ncbi:MAG: SurA N-terminal domain-containing protein [Coriobacteriia bacterium]|nr:SurA N-terminal domain-containing protein [Coriobacteriia bacterium]
MENNDTRGEFELRPSGGGSPVASTDAKPIMSGAAGQTPGEDLLPSRAERKKHEHEAEKPERSEHHKKPEKRKKAEKPEKPAKPAKPAKPKKREKPEKPKKSRKSAAVLAPANADVDSDAGQDEALAQGPVLFALEDENKKAKGDSKLNPKVLIVAAAAVVVVAIAVVLVLLLRAGTITIGTGKLAARVNGDSITAKQLDAAVAKLKMQNPQLFTVNSGISAAQVRSSLLDELVSQKLIMQEAKNRGVNISDAQVNQEVDKIKKQYSSQQQFDEKLKQQGYTLDTLKTQLKYQLIFQGITEKLVPESSISDSDVTAYYNAHKEEFVVAKDKQVAQIQFALKDEAKADDVLKQLKGGADFATLAQKNSIDAKSAAQGGVLGWTRAIPPLDKTQQEAVNNLGKGEISAVIKSSSGLFILKVTDAHEASTKTLQEASASIKTNLLNTQRNKTAQNLLADLHKKAKIVVYDKEVKDYRAKKDTTTKSSPAGK